MARGSARSAVASRSYEDTSGAKNVQARTQREVVVVGAGIAGLATALHLSGCRVTVFTGGAIGEGTASAWAQGGIAAAVGPDDDPALHAADTLAVAGGIADADVVAQITGAGPTAIRWLTELGARFDRDADGRFRLGREAGHGRRRIVHAADATGREIMHALASAVERNDWIDVVPGVTAEELVVRDGRVVGVLGRRDGLPFVRSASAVVLATGGIGALYRHTTNPATARGDGIALAARAGAVLADLEFVQFHPTALDLGGDPMPLCTEGLRGEGAVLIDERGRRIMAEVHPDADLAPRDVVARAMWWEQRAGHRIFLDCRCAIGATFARRFPTVDASCRAAGLDPAHEPIPVTPAAHYHMGGIAADRSGRTSLAGAWACGEVSATGLHGANRLASNSVLEAVATASYVASDILQSEAVGLVPLAVDRRPWAATDTAAFQRVRTIMEEHVGVVRDAAGLRAALGTLADLERARAPGDAPLRNVLTTATLVTAAALRRQESRGAHFRSDFPEPAAACRRRQFMTLAEIERPPLDRGVSRQE